MALALFDLDNTLLAGDSDHGWGIFLAEIGAVDPVEQTEKQDYFYQQYQAEQLDMDEFLQFQLKPLSQHPLETLHKWRAAYLEEVIQPLIKSGKRELLIPHQENGDDVVIITATNDFITRPIATSLGVETLLSTVAEFKNGSYTGNYTGTPCYRDGKVSVLKEWTDANSKNLEGSFFYSDSINDLPLLNLVSTAIAVTPDEKLRAHALQHSWAIID